jgi:hypothetical protein
MSQTEQKATVLGETPDLRALLRAMEDERLNTEKLAQQTSGEVVLEDGTGTGDPSALVLRDQAVEAKNNAETAVGASGLDGIVDTETGLPAAGNHGGDYYLVHSDSSGRSEAVYRSDGTSWSFTGIALLNEGQTGSPNGVAELDGTTTVPASQISEDSVEQHAPAVHLQSHIDAGQAGLTLGQNVSASAQSTNADLLQGLADEASGGNGVLQLPSGVIEHDQPLHLYDDGDNSFSTDGRFRMEGVTDYTNRSQGTGPKNGTILRYTGDPSLVPYRFNEESAYAAQRFIAHHITFEAETNEGVPVVKAESMFQRSELTDFFVSQRGAGDGMIVRDSWVSSFERIFCKRLNATQPHTNGIGFQFHNKNFAAGNVRISRVTGSGFRYGVVIGGLQYGEGSAQTTTYTQHLQGQNCYVGVVFGFAAGGYSDNLYAESCTKASYWIMNRAGPSIQNLYSFIGADGKANIQLGMSRGSPGGSPEMPFTGTASDDVSGALRDTTTDFGAPENGTAIGDPVYNTSGSKPYPRAFVTDIKTERQLGNGQSGAVHQLELSDDIFDAGDDYAVSWDLDDYTCTPSQEDADGKYDGETKPIGDQAAVRGVNIEGAGFAPYRSVGVLYRASGRTQGVRVAGANGSQKNGAVTAVSAGELVDDNADFTGGFYSVHVGDAVVNRDTGAEATVTEVLSSTRLGLDSDIFTDPSHTYAVSGATIIVNSTVQDLGVSFEDIANRFGVSDAIQSPEYVGSASFGDPGLPDRQLAPTSREGVHYEVPERWNAGTHLVPVFPNRTWEQATLHILLPITGDTTMELPAAGDPKVQNRVLRFFRTDDSPGNVATITDPARDIDGAKTNGSGDVVLEPGEGVYMHASYVSGYWSWTVIETAANVSVSTLTNNTGGTTDGTLAQVSGTGDDATVNNNLAELNAKIDALINQLSS